MLGTSRRWPVALAAGLMVALPVTAFIAAPSAAAHPASKSPGSKLAGINTDSTASGVQMVAFMPGIVPVGNPAKGDFLQASMPFSHSTASTGPSTAGTAAPAWPGDVAANAGNAIQTFQPTFPKPLVALLNDPAAAHSSYPAQLNVHASGKFEPGPSQAGVGGASTTSAQAGTFAKAELNDTAPLGPASNATPLGRALAAGAAGSALTGHALLPSGAGSPLLELGSASTLSNATVHAASVDTTAQARVSRVSIVGLIDIGGIASDAAASTDGKKGRQLSDLKLGAVTFAGLSASIGPKGITINKQSSLTKTALVPAADTLLKALTKAGLTVKTIAPEHKVHGSHATVSSGAVQVSILDKNVPNLSALLPGVPLPLPNSAELQINLGVSQADADATPFPKAMKPGKIPTTPLPQPTGASTGGGGGSVPPATGSSGVGTVPTGGVGTTTTAGAGDGVTPLVAQPAAAVVFGIPLRVVWVVVGLLLALMAAGPLLAYANWQLLRGRTP